MAGPVLRCVLAAALTSQLQVASLSCFNLFRRSQDGSGLLGYSFPSEVLGLGVWWFSDDRARCLGRLEIFSKSETLAFLSM